MPIRRAALSSDNITTVPSERPVTNPLPSLLVLGSKPDPALPPAEAFEALACANASGYSAARCGLPAPTYTVLSAILTSGKASGSESIRALSGLETDTVYFLPRPPKGNNAPKRLLNAALGLRMHPAVLRSRLKAVSYRYSHFADQGWRWYRDLLHELCEQDHEIIEQVARKHPSSGIVALAIGLAQGRYQRFIVAGFSFEVTHGYGANPEVAERGSAHSRHADTDIAVIRCLARKHGNIFTTEKIVHARTQIPMLGD